MSDNALISGTGKVGMECFIVTFRLWSLHMDGWCCSKRGGFEQYVRKLFLRQPLWNLRRIVNFNMEENIKTNLNSMISSYFKSIFHCYTDQMVDQTTGWLWLRAVAEPGSMYPWGDPRMVRLATNEIFRVLQKIFGNESGQMHDPN